MSTSTRPLVVSNALEDSMMDLIYLVMIAALFMFSIWMIRTFDRM